MPLASRGTANRADRAADTASATPPAEATQPRVKKNVPTPPPEPQTPPPADTTQEGAGGAAADSGAAVQPKTRKVRTPRPTAELDVGNDPKEWRKRQTAIEKEFKNLNREMAAAQREVANTFAERRRALESEHRLLGTKLSAHVFTG